MNVPEIDPRSFPLIRAPFFFRFGPGAVPGLWRAGERGDGWRAGLSAGPCAGGTGGTGACAGVRASLQAGITDGGTEIFYYLATAKGTLLGCRGAAWLLASLKFPFARGCDLFFDL